MAKNNLPHQDSPEESPRRYHPGLNSSSGSGLSAHRAQSITSIETGQTSSLSATSSAAWSGSHESLGSFGSFGSGLQGKQNRRRRRSRKVAQPLPKRPSEEQKKRIFQCTFCTDTFRAKYDWTRHEKSLHLSLEKWICAPLGPVYLNPSTGVNTCVYCLATEPTREHIESHSHSQCENKGLESRTFYRKDHLRQHLRLMHDCELLPYMDS